MERLCFCGDDVSVSIFSTTVSLLNLTPDTQATGDTMGNISGLVSGIANVDSGGCPSPFISEDLHPFTGGCEYILLQEKQRKRTDHWIHRARKSKLSSEYSQHQRKRIQMLSALSARQLCLQRQLSVLFRQEQLGTRRVSHPLHLHPSHHDRTAPRVAKIVPQYRSGDWSDRLQHRIRRPAGSTAATML